MPSLVTFFDDADGSVAPKASDEEIEKKLDVERIPASRATQYDMDFPEMGVAYVRHPARSTRLLPLASYHSLILKEKTNEAVEMLTALGASKIDLFHSLDLSSTVRAELDAVFGVAAIRGQKRSNEKVRVLFHSEGAGSAPRALPPMLWLGEPGWRGIVDGRLNANMTDFSLSFTYDHRAGVTAELAASVKKVGLKLGGDFHQAHRVAFELEGSFPALRS